jgi:hypothetical protein
VAAAPPVTGNSRWITSKDGLSRQQERRRGLAVIQEILIGAFLRDDTRLFGTAKTQRRQEILSKRKSLRLRVFALERFRHVRGAHFQAGRSEVRLQPDSKYDT